MQVNAIELSIVDIFSSYIVVLLFTPAAHRANSSWDIDSTAPDIKTKLSDIGKRFQLGDSCILLCIFPPLHHLFVATTRALFPGNQEMLLPSSKRSLARAFLKAFYDDLLRAHLSMGIWLLTQSIQAYVVLRGLLDIMSDPEPQPTIEINGVHVPWHGLLYALSFPVLDFVRSLCHALFHWYGLRGNYQ